MSLEQLNKFVTIFFLFVFGAVYPVLLNMLYMNGYPYNDKLKLQFQKPFFVSTVQFFGLSFFIILDFIFRKTRCCNGTNESFNWTTFRKSLLVSTLSVFATILQNYSLIFMETTVWQQFFGIQALFTTLFAATYRHQKLFLLDWLGLFVTVSGICVAGVGSLVQGIKTKNTSISGVFFSLILVIFSHGIRSFQSIIEEKMTHDDKVTTITLASCEGLWGLFFFVFLILPFSNIADPSSGIGAYENSIESLKMIGKSRLLVIVLFLFAFCAGIFQMISIHFIALTTAIYRNLYENIRPFFVWLISVITYYYTPYSIAGEKIDKFSTFDIIGFIISLIGTLIFNRIIKLPCFYYDELPSDEAIDNDFQMTTIKNDLIPE